LVRQYPCTRVRRSSALSLERHLGKLLRRIPRAQRPPAQVAARLALLRFELGDQRVRLVVDRDEDLVGVLLGVFKKASVRDMRGDALIP
jgi:hypothetical protein